MIQTLALPPNKSLAVVDRVRLISLGTPPGAKLSR